jgi:hypothetical protein
MLDDRDTGRPILHDYPQPESDLAAGDPLVVCSNLRYCIRSVLVRLSDQPQHHDTGDEQYYTANDDKRQAVLDRDAHRRPIALQQYCKAAGNDLRKRRHSWFWVVGASPHARCLDPLSFQSMRTPLIAGGAVALTRPWTRQTLLSREAKKKTAQRSAWLRVDDGGAESRSAFRLSSAISPSTPCLWRIDANSERRIANSLIVPFKNTSAICHMLPLDRIR